MVQYLQQVKEVCGDDPWNENDDVSWSFVNRVYDRKLAILGLSAIMSRPVDMWPAVMRNVSTLKNVVISCARLLHDNVEQRKRKGTAMETNSFNKSTHPIPIPITPVAFEKEREEQERQSTSATACAAIGSAASLAQDQGYNSDEDVQHHSNYRLLANFVRTLPSMSPRSDTHRRDMTRWKILRKNLKMKTRLLLLLMTLKRLNSSLR